MRYVASAALLLAFIATGCQTGPTRPKVRVTLNDGQVLVGELTTPGFNLKTSFGPLAFDAKHAGELGPLEGDDMHQAGRTIRLWLRNGSEFIGQWEKPAVQVALSLGGKEHTVDVPIEKVRRLQFFGEAVWDDRAVFRILTKSGDDFFVDVTRTQILFVTEMGNFDPFLSEIENLVPLNRKKNLWRVHFENGTVFHATIGQKELDLRLDIGPERLSLPMASVERMERQIISARSAAGSHLWEDLHTAGDDAEGYYTNSKQRVAKMHAAQSWKK